MSERDSPEIARLRRESILLDGFVEVSTYDLRYALALIDESCKSCAVVDEIRKQGARLDHMYALFDEVMKQQRGKRPWDEAPHEGDEPRTVPGVVELRTCNLDGCVHCGGESNG